MQHTQLVERLYIKDFKSRTTGQTTYGENGKRCEHRANKKGRTDNPCTCEERLTGIGNEANVKRNHRDFSLPRGNQVGKIKKATDAESDEGEGSGASRPLGVGEHIGATTLENGLPWPANHAPRKRPGLEREVGLSHET